MEYNIIIGLGEGLIYDKQTSSRSFLAYEKKLAKQLHFHSDLSSTLRFSQQIASLNRQHDAVLLSRLFCTQFCMSLCLSYKRMEGGLGVSLSLFSH